MKLLPTGIFNVRATIAQFREQIDEHLVAINENTDEIQANYSYMQEIDNKLAKIACRLEQIESMLGAQAKKYCVRSLTYQEKQVFLVLYTYDSPLTYPEIAQKTGYTEALVKHYMAGIIEKGIPLIKSYFNGNPFIKLEPGFKELQAKENVINLSLQSFVE